MMYNLVLMIMIIIVIILGMLVFFKQNEKNHFTNKKNTVAICFFGLTRSLDFTIDSIKNNILAPLEESNINYDIILHTYDLKYIKLKRSGENNKLNTEEWNKLNPDYYKIDNQDTFDKSYNYEYVKSFGDAWNTNFENTINLIRQFNSLKQVWKLVESTKNNYECLIFLRPDLKYTTKLDIRYINKNLYSNIILTPYWQKWGGINDRIGIGNYNTMEKYANRLDDVSDFLESTKKPLHAEKFLKFVLNKYNIKNKELKLVGKRIRSNGSIEKSDKIL